MISQNPYSNCLSARLYYYDFLNKESKEDIPEGTLNHINNCPDCQAEIDQLETLLTNIDERSEEQENRRNSAITTLLKLHFSYVDERVTCKTVKPFLASLADSALQILIPTPITEHIDECRNCRDDLLTIRDFHLTHKQLCRLGQLLAEKSTDDTVSCSQARQAIPAVASLVFRKTNAEVLKHLSACPQCRQTLLQYREGLSQKQPDNDTDQDTIPCRAVSPSDIYDYALPYGIDPSDDEYAEFREPLALHLGGCPTCMAKVLELQKTIYRIADRSESDVVTVYHVDELIAAHKPVNFTARLKQITSSPKVRPWLKVSVAAAAAVIIISLGLMLNEPTVEANSYDQMSAAIEKARNLHITTYNYSGNKPKVTQETWLSQSLGFYMLKDMNKYDLMDFTKKLRKVRALDSNLVDQIILPNNEKAKIEGNTAAYLNLLPFAYLSKAPQGTTWNPATGDDITTAIQSSEVFDLVRTTTTARGSQIFYRWRFYIDPEKNLPNTIEYSRKLSKSDDYTLISKIVVEQMKDSEMQDAIDKVFP